MNGVDDNAKADESVKVQYLAMVQGVISRMGTYSVAIKTGCIALVAALFVFMSPGSSLPAEKVVLYCVPFAVTVLVCAFFDARYLQLERSYRGLYADMLAAEGELYDRSMKAPLPSCKSRSHYHQCFFSWSVSGFYTLLLLVAAVSFAAVFACA